MRQHRDLHRFLRSPKCTTLTRWRSKRILYLLAPQTRRLKHPVNLILAGAMTSDRRVGRLITTVLVNRPAGHEDGGTYPGAWEHSWGCRGL